MCITKRKGKPYGEMKRTYAEKIRWKHEKVRAEIEEERKQSTQIFIRQVIEEHLNRLEGKGEKAWKKRTLTIQV